CVSTTLRNLVASLLISGTISSPPATARLPPGRKSYCTSTTSRTSSGRISIMVLVPYPFGRHQAAHGIAQEDCLGPGEIGKGQHTLFRPAGRQKLGAQGAGQEARSEGRRQQSAIPLEKEIGETALGQLVAFIKKNHLVQPMGGMGALARLVVEGAIGGLVGQPERGRIEFFRGDG